MLDEIGKLTSSKDHRFSFDAKWFVMGAKFKFFRHHNSPYSFGFGLRLLHRRICSKLELELKFFILFGFIGFLFHFAHWLVGDFEVILIPLFPRFLVDTSGLDPDDSY